MSHPHTHDAIVIGAGPSGLLLAAELHRLGLDVAHLERRPEAGGGSRAIGVHAAALVAMEASGAIERLLAHALRVPAGEARSGDRLLGVVRFDLLPQRFPFVATLPQRDTERAIAVGAGPVRRDCTALAVAERRERVDVTVSGAAGAGEIRARAVVIASGSRGRGILPPALRPRARPGTDHYLMSDVVTGADDSPPIARVTLDAAGVVESFPLPGGRRLVAWDRRSAAPWTPRHDDLDRLRAAVAERSGDAASAALIGRATGFRVSHAQPRRMRLGRLFVVGDAAHEISPIGGQGMNLGLIDAATLAPVLAARLRARSTGSLAEAEAALRRWEQARVASARIAGRISVLNTGLGRALPSSSHRLLTAALGAGLSGTGATLAARAYSMGFDRAGGISRPVRR